MGVTRDTIYNLKLSEISKDFFIRSDYDYFKNMEAFLKELKGTKLRKLKEITTFLETGRPIEQKDYAPLETTYVHIVPRNVKEGELDITEPIYLTEEKAKELKEFRLEKGDILMVISSNVGDTVLFNLDNETQYTISHYIIRLRIDETQYLPEFLVYYLNHPKAKLYFRAVETGKTQQNLSKTYIYNLLIPDTPKEKQKEIMKGTLTKVVKKKELKIEIKRLTNETEKKFWDRI